MKVYDTDPYLDSSYFTSSYIIHYDSYGLKPVGETFKWVPYSKMISDPDVVIDATDKFNS